MIKIREKLDCSPNLFDNVNIKDQSKQSDSYQTDQKKGNRNLEFGPPVNTPNIAYE